MANHCEPPPVLVWGPEDLPCSYRCPLAPSEGHRRWKLWRNVCPQAGEEALPSLVGAGCWVLSGLCQVRATGLRPARGGGMPGDAQPPPQKLPRVPPPTRPPKGEAPTQLTTVCSLCPSGLCWQPRYRCPREARKPSAVRHSLTWDSGTREQG